MSSATHRLHAVQQANNFNSQCESIDAHTASSDELFGRHVFNLTKMRERLSARAFQSLEQTISEGGKLDPSIAEEVANAMKEWALEHGATHYAHIFFPLTGLSAEKHDAFLSPTQEGVALTEFKPTTLIQGEPDASSFPNGGIRATFEARGYTAWDVTSPAYIVEKPSGSTLCIPTAFISWTGEALDEKTPVLRSQQALDKAAKRILKLFGHTDIAQVTSYCGAEQEYFLIDKSFLAARPDLLNTGRTVFGAPPPKGQEFDDHYFGAIPERVLAFMMEVERELFLLGVPAKTRHNEVAPGQFEIAPVFEVANLATDHQQLIMTTLRSVAPRHGLVCLLHEKPFAQLNGSGKHVNYSFGNTTQGNLLEPGKNPHANHQFLVFCASIIQAVHRHAKVLRCSIANAGNDHRLGANEAPPAIMSIFLGEQLSGIFEQLRSGDATHSKQGGELEVSVDSIPNLLKDAGDRNRTSPIAFTGNRFEFRAVGASQSVAAPVSTLNTIIADSLQDMADRLEKRIEGASPMDLARAVQEVLGEIIREHGNIVFDGDGYASEWPIEAEKRGLPNLPTTVHALPALLEEESLAVFERQKVLSRRESESRYEINVERYTNSLNVEANLCIELAQTQVLPAVRRYQRELAETGVAVKSLGLDPDLDQLEDFSGRIVKLRQAVSKLAQARSCSRESEGIEAARKHLEQTIPAMTELRSVVDALEGLCADDLWPLATYQEMLFFR